MVSTGLANCDFWCDTDGEKIESGVEKTKFVWRVKNFSARPEQKGEHIDSGSFTVISPKGVATKWKLGLYPNGTTSAKDGYMSVFLCIMDTNARASYKIYIQDQHGNETILLYYSNEFREMELRGRQNALLIGQLKEKLNNDVLTLVCEMSVLETFYDIKKNHQLQMMKDLGKAFKEKKSVDVTVHCGDMTFLCNKFMLVARSPVFEAMFQHETLESQTNVVNIKDIEPKVLEEMFLYIQTGEAPNINNIAKELLVAADFYQLDQLKISCQEVLSETLEAKNSIEILILSDMHSAPKLKKDALKFISENMNSVSLSCDWKKELACHPSLQSEIIESLMNIMSKDDTKG